jgi:predicted Zn-dependent protease
MTSPQDIVERALAASSSRGCAVIVSSQSIANLRWARSTLTTNGETVTTSVTVVAFVDVPATATSPAGVASGSVTVSAPTEGEIPDVVRRAEAIAAQSGAAEDATPLVRGGAASDDWADAPVVATAAELSTIASRLGQVFGAARSDGIELFGYAEQAVTTLYLGTSEGVRRRFAQPEARFEATAKSHGRSRSTWAGRAAQHLDVIDVAEVDLELRQALAWQARSVDVAPGRHTAVLAPASVADLMIELYWSSVGRDAADGQSVWSRAGGGTRLGDVVADARASLWSDPAMPGYESMPFVATGSSSGSSSVFDNGLAVEASRWIDHGSLAGLITSRHTATQTSLPLRPGVGNLRLDVDGGQGGLADVVGRVDDGLLVTCLWYNRVLDPQTLLLTGLTRDGVYQVRGGEVVGAVTNFRFNDSPVGILNRILDAGASVGALGREMADYFTRTLMPTLVVDGYNFSTVSPAS